MKTIIERGASWTLEETKMLLQLWGLDCVQRQATNTKRTKEVYEKIADKLNQHGHERTADQVRTRVFNMIAEYRRILKDPTPERMKKCIFFEALHKIYQAKHMDDVRQALDDYEPEYPYSPSSNTISSEKGDESVSDSEATEGNETINNSNSNNTTSNIANSTTNDNNNGDSNNNNDAEKESHLANSHSTGTASKKIKLESQKSGQNQTNQANNTATASTSTTNSTLEHNNAKQNKQAATSTPLVTPIVTAGASSSSSSTSQRHQSLLLPTTIAPGSSATTSTPISKFTTAGNTTPSYININSTKLPIIRTNQLIGHPNGNDATNSHPNIARLPTTAALTSHQLYQAPVNTFDVTSSALLIDRMFAHLSRESENMREWIALEKERLALERVRRQQETEREVRRERVLIDTLMRFQDQWLGFMSRLDPGLLKNSPEFPPELKVSTNDTTATTDSSTATTTAASTQSSTNSNSTSSDANK